VIPRIPKQVERSTYVLIASLALVLLYGQRRPMPDSVWRVGNPAGTAVLQVIFCLGSAIVMVSTFLIRHSDLFGLRQVWWYFSGKNATSRWDSKKAAAVSTGAASHLSGFSIGLLVNARQYGCAFVVLAGHDRLHLCRDLVDTN
jgi:protein-S-isoprenylcysteine O-methyltransferase Ste14